MRFAVLNAAGDLVENVVVARENQREELEAALGRALVDAAPLGLLPGDTKNRRGLDAQRCGRAGSAAP